MKHALKIILTALLIPLAAGCGKKGPPRPPEDVLPGEAGEMSVRGRAEGLVVSWLLPTRTQDGSPLKDLAGFKLYRKEEGKACRRCPSDFPLYRDIDLEAPAGVSVEGGRLFYLDTEVESGTTYLYRIAPYNRSGDYGEMSPPVRGTWLSPPPPPDGVRGSAADGAVALSWAPSPLKGEEGFLGYLLYRGTASGVYPRTPVHAGYLQEETYNDGGLTNNTPYYYVIKTVAGTAESSVESLPSQELFFVPVDLVPPGPPTGVTAIPRGGGVGVFWEAPGETDLLGYNIYRRREGEPAMERINADPVPRNSYQDEGVKKGGAYLYSVTALDGSPQHNESTPSAEVRVAVPR